MNQVQVELQLEQKSRGGSLKMASIPPNVQIISLASHTIIKSHITQPFNHSLHSNIASSSTQQHAKPFISIHPSFFSVLSTKPSIRVLAQSHDSTPFAHEAGVYIPHTQEVWFTSNLYSASGHSKDGLRNVKAQISRINVKTGSITPVSIDSMQTPNGGCPFGSYILFCDQGSSTSPSQLVLVNPNDPQTSIPLLNNYNGRPFNSLNDVIVLPPPQSPSSPPSPASPPLDRPALPPPGSTIWFTDPTYGYEQSFKPEPLLPSMVYVFDPSTGVVKPVEDGLEHPNGISFSPDGRTCYITDTSHIRGCGTLRPGKASTIYAYDVHHPPNPEDLPSLRNKRLFAFADCGVPDGIKCDNRGNVYAGCGDGIHVWNSQGSLIGKILPGLIDDPKSTRGIANFCFVPGGKLLCLAEDSIYLVEGLEATGDLLRGI